MFGFVILLSFELLRCYASDQGLVKPLELLVTGDSCQDVCTSRYIRAGLGSQPAIIQRHQAIRSGDYFSGSAFLGGILWRGDLWNLHLRNQIVKRVTGCFSSPTILLSFAMGGILMLYGCGPDGQTESLATALRGPAPGAVAGVSLSVAWDPVSDPTVVGYTLYYGTSSTNSFGSCAYKHSIFSSSSSVTISGLEPNTTYYFAVSAYNGLSSACSAEVSTTTRPT